VILPTIMSSKCQRDAVAGAVIPLSDKVKDHRQQIKFHYFENPRKIEKSLQPIDRF